MLDELLSFEWDIHNVDHIALHGVSPTEVEEATGRTHVIIPAAPKGKEKRWKLFGRSETGRYLVVVFTIRHRKFRTVTAYTMNQIERRVYGPKIQDGN